MQNKLHSKVYIFILLFIGIINVATGQDNSLSIDNTLDIVRKFHPVIKQSFLQNEIARNELLASKGIFDPTLQISNEEKTFDNKLYYKYTTTELKIPLWYGVDIKAGTENNIGDKIDPSLTQNNSAFVGISVDPFRGIIVDKRKNIVKQAKNIVDLTKNEQLLVINDLLLDASTTYWNWVNAHNANTILKKTIKNNKERYAVIINSFLSGDRAPVDTTEALAQLQSFEIMQTQAELELQKARLELSNFFWKENGAPYELDDVILPTNSFDLAKITTTDIGNLDELIDQALKTHPKIKMLNNKSTILDIEKRLKTVELFPSLKVNYNALENNLSSFNWNANTNNNFKYGVSLSMPLFQRQARGELSKTKNKIEDLNWDKKYIGYEIENKVKSTFAEFHALKQQIKTNEAVVYANKLLLDVENTKFQMGESSLFLINSRELKFIETELKQITLKVKFYNSIYKNLWSLGTLN